MSATKTYVNKAFEEYRKQMEDEIEKKCKQYCVWIVEKAIDERRSAGHNFTGNLITSIVVCLYKKKKPLAAFFAEDYLKKAIDGKMTAGGAYVFRMDYDDEEETRYVPEVETDMGYGKKDAINFYRSYKPTGNNLFDIVVAYPVEYADFVERERQATGILRTYDYTSWVGVEIFELGLT